MSCSGDDALFLSLKDEASYNSLVSCQGCGNRMVSLVKKAFSASVTNLAENSAAEGPRSRLWQGSNQGCKVVIPFLSNNYFSVIEPGDAATGPDHWQQNTG